MPSRLQALLLGALAHHGATQTTIPAPTDLKQVMGAAGVPIRYKEVPAGICEMRPDVKSYSGYADVAENQHIYFWFFEARNGDPTKAPTTTWLNGGPGSSSTPGLFHELGPCGVDYWGEPYDNPYSWTSESNMIFIEQPAGVGLSYTEPVYGYVDLNDPLYAVKEIADGSPCPSNATCGTWSKSDPTMTINSTEAGAVKFWQTLQGVMGAFPQYFSSGNQINFATESYGGHYGPAYCKYFKEQNAKNVEGAVHVNLQNLLIMSGLHDISIQYPWYYNFTVKPGNSFDFFPFNDTEEAALYDSIYQPGACLDLLSNCSTTGDDNACMNGYWTCLINLVFPFILKSREVYDIRFLEPSPFPYAFQNAYLNTPKVQAALGAFTNFSDLSLYDNSLFLQTGDQARAPGGPAVIKELLDMDVRVTLWAGDADYICNWYGVQAIAEAVGAPGYSCSGFVNMTASNGQIYGEVRESANFSFIRIYDAGHEIPFYKPLATLDLFNRLIDGVDMATGETAVHPGYVTKGPAVSTYHQGNATIQWEVISKNYTWDTEKNGPGLLWNETEIGKSHIARG